MLVGQTGLSLLFLKRVASLKVSKKHYDTPGDCYSPNY